MFGLRSKKFLFSSLHDISDFDMHECHVDKLCASGSLCWKSLSIIMKIKEMELLISVVLLFVGIAVLVIIHVCIAGRAFRGGNQGNNMVQRSRKGIKRMSIEDLEKLPCFDYREKAAEKWCSCSVDCAVCLENFKIGEKCRLLPNCRHSFHVQCIDTWLLKTPICPTCRTCVNPPTIDVILREESEGVRVELTIEPPV